MIRVATGKVLTFLNPTTFFLLASQQRGLNGDDQVTDAHRASAANYLVPEPAYSLYLSNMWRKFAEMQIFIVLTICAAVTTAKPGCKAEIEDLCPDFFPPHPPNGGSCQSCASAQQAKFKICNLVRYEEEILTF